MESKPADGMTLFFDPVDRVAAAIVGDACERSVALIGELWGLVPPADCRIYLMASWAGFAFRSAPWGTRVAMALLFPFWAPRAARVWRYAGGWHQRYGRRVAVGIKPPRLLKTADRSLGDRIFVRPDDVDQHLAEIVSHELTHALSGHLRLPMWLNEGLAMVTVDRFAARETVQRSTLDSLAKVAAGGGPISYRKAQAGDDELLIYHVVRGYWLTRYVQEEHPALLTELLAARLTQPEVDEGVAAAFGVAPAEFWHQIDHTVATHFSR